MQKFTKQLPKEDLKRFAKEVGKKLVASDFKHGRVEDPTKISEKQEKKVKKFVKDYFEKVVEKKKAVDKRKREKEQATTSVHGAKISGVNGTGKAEKEDPSKEESDGEDDEVDLTPNSPIPELAQSPSISATPVGIDSPDLKRKRTEEDILGEDSESNKRFKDDDISPPPPPPPPPTDGMPDADMLDSDMINGQILTREETEEERELRQQEEDLMRENEEAMKMDLDGTLKKEELVQKSQQYPLNTVHGNGTKLESDYLPKDSMDSINGAKLKREGMMSH